MERFSKGFFRLAKGGVRSQPRVVCKNEARSEAEKGLENSPNNFASGSYELTNVFHLENDVMLYADLSELLPHFGSFYSGIVAVFDNDQRCIPSFVYFLNRELMRRLAAFFAKKAHLGYHDMKVLALFKNENSKEVIDYLPIINEEYAGSHRLISPSGITVQDEGVYSNYFHELRSIFDAAAIGQYLGGIDPRNGPLGPGFINEDCIFNPSHFQYVWEVDEEGRRVPFALYKEDKFRINNLHIHSKRLEEFTSR